MGREQAPIAAEFKDCIQCFQSLISEMELKQQEWASEYLLLSDYRSRLLAWGSHTGASSRRLDHAVRQSSRLRMQTLDLLESLNSSLQRILEVVQMTALPLLSPPIVQNTGRHSYFDPRTAVDESVQIMASSNESMKIVLDNITMIGETLGCLARLVSSLRNPVPSDGFSAGAQEQDAQEDIDRAARMFPKATPGLKQRLGQGNWKRRQYLRNLRAKSGRKEIRKIGEAPVPSSDAQGIQMASRTKTAAKGPEVGFINDPSFLNYRTLLGRGTARTSYSETSSQDGSTFSIPGSYTSYTATSAAASDDGPSGSRVLIIPRPPVELESDNVFQCPYCLYDIVVGDSIVTNADWADHVFSDLEPYMCTSESCLHAKNTYGLREDWFRHELDNHRTPKIWFCQSCKTELPSENLFEEHLRINHDYALPPTQLSMVASLCQRYSQQPLTDIVCPLCGLCCSRAEEFCAHVASHLEHLALTSIVDEEDLDESAPSSPGYTFASPAFRDEVNRIQEFVFEQSQRYLPETTDNFFLDRILQDVDGSEAPDAFATLEPDRPAVNAARVSANTRPIMAQRGASYTYMSKIRGLKTAELGLPEKIRTDSDNNIPGAGPTNRSSSHAIRTLQPSRNTDFIGRIDDMKKLHEILFEQGHTCVLSGVGGLGKSALAAEYTYRFESAYTHIFWVQAEDPMLCAESFSQIAIKCVCTDSIPQEQELLITLGREFLERTKEKWLLVFDNVDQWPELNRYLLPNMEHCCGSVLITTNKMDLGRLALPIKYTQTNLGPLSLEESRRLLLSSTQASLLQADMRTHPEYKLAGDIAKLAERLPLALSLIAGYVLVSGCSLADFVELWNERRKNTTITAQTRDNLSSEADRAMETVWNIGLREVTMDARELLNILAFLDNDTIQKDLLVGVHEDPLLEILHSSETVRYKRMTTELKRRRLVRIENRDGKEVLSIHRKLQSKILHDLDTNTTQRERVLTQAFLLVRACFPFASPIQVPEPEKWSTCKKYLPHVLRIRRLYQTSAVGITPSVKLAQLFSDGGINLWERGLTKEGLGLLKSAEEILNHLDCSEVSLRANIHVIISLLLQDSGLTHIAECMDRSETALQIRRDYHARTAPSAYTKNDEILLYNAWSDYGCVLLQYNNFHEAEPIFAQCYEKYKTWGEAPSIPYEYAKYFHHMAFCHMYRGDHASAVALGEQGLHWVREATGESGATNRWKFDLACIVLQSGDLKRALQLHREVLDARIKQHGKAGHLTLQSQYAVGAVEAYLGRLEESEASMRKVLDTEKARQGSCPAAAVARTRFHLSHILGSQGKNVEEEEELARLARKALQETQPLEPLKGVVAKDHELAMFDHLQPVFDGRFTGLWILRYLS